MALTGCCETKAKRFHDLLGRITGAVIKPVKIGRGRGGLVDQAPRGTLLAPEHPEVDLLPVYFHHSLPPTNVFFAFAQCHTVIYYFAPKNVRRFMAKFNHKQRVFDVFQNKRAAGAKKF